MEKSNELTKEERLEYLRTFKNNNPIRKDKEERKEYLEYEYWTIKISKEQTEYDKIRLEILSNLI